jgi:hypothetical protein
MTADPHSRAIRASIEGLLGPIGEEVSCEQCFELLDAYLELELKGGDAETRFPGMREHLSGCPACHEDLDSLRALVQASE